MNSKKSQKSAQNLESSLANTAQNPAPNPAQNLAPESSLASESTRASLTQNPESTRANPAPKPTLTQNSLAQTITRHALWRRARIFIRFYVLPHTRDIFSPSYTVHWFFALLLAGIFLFMKIFATDTEAILSKRAQMPLMELYDFDIYNATDSLISSRVQGQKALRFAEYEISYETILSIIQESKDTKSKAKPLIEYIYGEEIRRVNDMYFFDKGGVYAKESGESFWSKRARYDMPNGIFYGNGDFWATSIEGSSEGQNLTYNQRLQTMKAEAVKARIDLQNTNTKGKQ